MPMGTLTKNTSRQSTHPTRTPPSAGPVAAATAPVAPQMAVAVARCASGNSGSSRASDVGTTAAAPSACSTRAAISIPGFGASPHSAEASRNTTIPTRNNRRRPIRSASRPAGIRAAANTTP